MNRPEIKTMANLEAAFAGESMAHIKYRYFAKIARAAGDEATARIFEETADQEVQHAFGHLDLLQPKAGLTPQICLQMAIEGETYEYSEMYPPMVEQAKSENHKGKTMLEHASKVERVHADLYQQALAALQAGKDLDAMDVYLCPVCGHLELGKPPEKCPICGLPAARYQKIG